MGDGDDPGLVGGTHESVGDKLQVVTTAPAFVSKLIQTSQILRPPVNTVEYPLFTRMWLLTNRGRTAHTGFKFAEPRG